MSAESSATKFFNQDRASKYGVGTLRLGVLVVLAFVWHAAKTSEMKNSFDVALPYYASLFGYFASPRCLFHAYIGCIGAYVNVEQSPLYVNLFFLVVAAVCILYDVTAYADYALVVYLLKTFSGDFIAGKLDTVEWKLVLAFTFALAAAAAYGYLGIENWQHAMQEYTRIGLLLFAIQVFCEYGDAHFEKYVFFRHRYSFEAANLAVLLLIPNLRATELRVLQFDLFICWCYRFGNFLIIVKNSDVVSKFVVKAIFSFFGALTSKRIVHVTDAAVASVIMKQFSQKGKGLEAYLSCPSWSPAISLESIDGLLWKEMRADFDVLLKQCPPVSTLQKITSDKAKALANSGAEVDAEAIARLTMQVFVAFLFGDEDGKPWGSDVIDPLVLASWEWRKEIAVRGKGNEAAKEAAIRILVDRLLPSSPLLWKLHGPKWREPRYFSLILQPFLISPTINTGDIMCASKMCPPGATFDQVLRSFHPFPIFERWVDSPVVLDQHATSTTTTSTSSTTSSASSSSSGCPFFSFLVPVP